MDVEDEGLDIGAMVVRRWWFLVSSVMMALAGSADVRRDGKGGLGIYSLFEKDDKKNLREVFKRGTEEGE
ncbi:hypothetical protein U1Q18_030391, partial [Sarracenia purpurea var. burkii]